ncbi:hypothetical protein GNI_041940 [Gregarina niphandrodes]|uniref:Uncharacterized protein n=1 Tax=Gregarina niphandrodes TaxID=110365 RepID=A0A023BA58_GRENI|nr:hypothetical protein GNI_041940 [Gregarina niphandrodes]EZG77552.1 hypothetical protein GNI_041940 [Gregarina niphandrodes]|eukprot:XP_011129497.1 hypothetical protein GNI_041940 [Gregarina niphandrodes]
MELLFAVPKTVRQPFAVIVEANVAQLLHQSPINKQVSPQTRRRFVAWLAEHVLKRHPSKVPRDLLRVQLRHVIAGYFAETDDVLRLVTVQPTLDTEIQLDAEKQHELAIKELEELEATYSIIISPEHKSASASSFWTDATDAKPGKLSFWQTLKNHVHDTPSLTTQPPN